MRRRRLESYGERLTAQLREIETRFLDIVDRSQVVYVNPSDDNVIFASAADWGWAPSDGLLASDRMELLREYSEWFERAGRLFAHATPDVADPLAEVDRFVRGWLVRNAYDHSIPRTLDEARQVATERFADLRRVLAVRVAGRSDVVRLVPDTSALLDNQDLESYTQATSGSSYVIHILPSIWRELDDIKDRANKTEEVRESARAMQRRLKGLRDKGAVREGVSLTRSVKVVFEHREPTPSAVIEWLESTVTDDRILASAVELQGSHPDDVVALVTSDGNLQNKADAAGLPYVETPPDPVTKKARLKPSITWRESREAEWVPVAVMENTGPVPADDLSYEVSSLGGPPHSRSGPWAHECLVAGASVQNDVWGFYGEKAKVRATWRDGSGPCEREWQVDFPPRPEPRVRTSGPRHRR